MGIAAGVILLLAAGGWLGWQALIRYFTRQYYRQAYEPIALAEEMIAALPAEHHLSDVPWSAASYPTCQSVSMQMIAAQQGVVQPHTHFDFLMGFTYGASELPGVGLVPFGTDPETGMKVAAPYVGLARRYYVTDDAALYRRALRHFLAQGYPVRVALDMGALYGADEFIAHSEVLVGYDAAGLYYYETVCIPPAGCQPGERGPGDRGLFVSDELLLDAVRSQAKLLKYPWRYALAVFEPGPAAADLAPVWAQNSQALLGGNLYGPKTGAGAIEALAVRIERSGRRFDASTIEMGIESAVTTRANNAAYLRQAFAGDEEILHAAALFDQAAEAYRAVQSAIGDAVADGDEAGQIAAHLRRAAAAEREIGQIFQRRAG